MLKNYFKVALRVLTKNKLYAGINIVGLGMAMAMCVVGYVNYQFSTSFDSFHENKERIIVIEGHRSPDGAFQRWSLAPFPLAPKIESELPMVDKVSRMSIVATSVQYRDRIFSEVIECVDNSFFDIFTIPLVNGDLRAFYENNGIVVSSDMAEKYFGTENPVGEELILRGEDGRPHVFLVSGVFNRLPKNSSLSLDFCIPIQRLTDFSELDLNNWDNYTRATIVLLNAGADRDEFTRLMQPYLSISNAANPALQFDDYGFIPLTEMGSKSRDLIYSPYQQGMHPTAIIAPSIMALLILILACFNFVNTAVAFASRRLKEIGIRKVVGGMRSQLIKQFMCENFILCFIALLIGAVLSEIFVPAYDSLWPELSLTLDYSQNLKLVAFFAGLLGLTAIGAGIYPSLYISSFSPAAIFKGRQKLGGTNPLIRILLTIQLALSMTTIVAALILTQNASFIQSMDLGYERDNIFMVRVDGGEQYQLLKHEIERHPQIESIGATRNQMARFWSNIYIRIGETDDIASSFEVGENYIETIGFTMVAGRSFNTDLTSDLENSVIVNEMLADRYGITLGENNRLSVKDNDTLINYTIIGVVKDFHPNSIDSPVQPAIIRLAPPERYYYLVARCTDEGKSEIAGYIGDTWKRVFPDAPYSSLWIEETLVEGFRTNDSIRKIFMFVAILVIVISGMGLFALVSLNIVKRTKEISIRKVLGATFSDISLLISKEFIILGIISSLLSGVMGYFLVSTFLKSIWTYYVDFSVMPFITSSLIVVFLAVLTISSQVFAAANSNPADTLRNE